MRPLFALSLVTLLACSGSSGGSPTTGCNRTTDCSAGLVCNQGTCIAPGSVGAHGACTASRDCSGNSYCSPAGTCAAAGAGSANAACVSDADCASGLRCELYGFGGTCVAGGQGESGDDCTASKACLPGLFCSGGSCTTFAQAFPPFRGVQCQLDPAPFHSYFVVPRPSNSSTFDDLFRLPWPNDARVSTASPPLDLTGFPRPGMTPLGVDVATLYAQALAADFDGFSAMTPIEFRFNGMPEFGDSSSPNFGNSIQGGGRPHLFDVTPGPTNGQEYGNFSLSFQQDASKFNCANLLLATPDPVPIALGHTYLAYLTTTLHSATGAVPTQDSDLTAVLGEARPSDPDLSRAWDKYEPARTFFKAHSIAVATIANATVFTVANVPAHMQHLAAAVATEGAPTLSQLFQCGTSTGTDPCTDGTPARTCGTDPGFIEIHGKIKMPIYQKGTAPYAAPSDGGALNESSGVVTKDHDDEICFGLTLPKTTMPAAGWPVVVYSHGTGGSFRSFITDGVAGKMAAAGVAAFSFDSVGHGARRGSSTKSPDALVFNVLNPAAARDNWLQGAADILTALKLPSVATPAGFASVKFAKVAFFGHSQGSTHGELALAVSNAAGAAVVSGAGAGLRSSLLDKTSPADVAGVISFLLGEQFTADHPMGLLWQNYFDRSDPANYNRLTILAPPAGLTPKNVMMTWGVGDTFAPASTLAENARTLGIPPVNPVLELFDGFMTATSGIARPVSKDLGSVLGAVFQYQPSGYDGHFVAQMNSDAQRDWSAFLTSFFTTGTPTVP